MIKYLIVILSFLIHGHAVSSAIVRVGNGTGFFVDPDTIVTANHVVAGSGEFVGVYYNNQYAMAKILKFNKDLDVAYLSVKDPSKKYLRISNDIFIGKPYYLYGFPSRGGGTLEYRRGHVSSLNFKIYSSFRGRSWERSASIGSSGSSNGFSGGPLIDDSGMVFGVLTNGDVRNAYFTSFNSLNGAEFISDGGDR